MKAVIIEDETAAAVNLQSILHRASPSRGVRTGGKALP